MLVDLPKVVTPRDSHLLAWILGRTHGRRVHPKFQGREVTVSGREGGWFDRVGGCPVTVTFSPGSWDAPWTTGDLPTA